MYHCSAEICLPDSEDAVKSWVVIVNHIYY